MAFLYNIKRAFGFGSAVDYDDEIEGIDATVHPLSQHKELPAAEVSSLDASTDSDNSKLPSVSDLDAAGADGDDSAKHKIFESVVKIFNESLPDFIKNALDTDAQSRYIYNALDDSLKTYISQIDELARKRNRSSWDKERQRLDSENKANAEKIKSLEERNEEGRKQQLSAERQKRALAERVHDLEGRIATLEAEKEQYDLENKSLLNKLRVTALQAEDAAAGVDLSVNQAELKLELEEIKEKYNASVAELAQAQAKADIADAMINDLNSKASDAQQKLSTAEETIKAVMEERDTATTQAAQLHERLTQADKELLLVKGEVKEAREAMKAIDEIQEQLSRFEEVKETKDKRISELSTENNRLVMIVESLKSEVSSLKKTIETNLYSQAESESALRREIDELRKSAIPKSTYELEELPPEPAKPVRRKRKPKISAIDESIDDTDWLVSTPPKSAKSIVSESETPFGYQPPVKKQHPENDAQMSLW